jgi:hypothetical protein
MDVKFFGGEFSFPIGYRTGRVNKGYEAEEKPRGVLCLIEKTMQSISRCSEDLTDGIELELDCGLRINSFFGLAVRFRRYHFALFY